MNPVLFVLNHSPPKAFYVDVGANHPVRGSMTFRLDQSGWRGVCVEPNPELAALYAGRRNCSLERRVIGDGKRARFVREKNDELSGLVLDGEEHAGGGAVVQTVRLEQALRERGAPQKIALLSVDVEGADEWVLSSELLRAFQFGFVLVERPRRETASRLFSSGFLFCKHFLYDGLFVHSSHTHAREVAHNETYSQLPSRCRSPATGKWLGRKRLPGPCKSVFGCCEPV
jgi:FkbM family methyltransferase